MYSKVDLEVYAKTGQWDYENEPNSEFAEMVRCEGYQLAKQETIEVLQFYSPGVYQSRLQDIWERYNEGQRPMDTITVNGTPITIPLSIKGSMWAWLVDKPVANKNPYRTLLEYCCEEAGWSVDYGSAMMYLCSENMPLSFDKRLVKPTEGFVYCDDTLDIDEIRISGVAGKNEGITNPQKEPQPVSIRIAEKKLSERIKERAPVVENLNLDYEPSLYATPFDQYMQAVKNSNK